jgi:hypothetical protein
MVGRVSVELRSPRLLKSCRSLVVLSSAPNHAAESLALVVGMGELGRVFALGMLQLGVTVVPILRTTPNRVLTTHQDAASICLVCVGEAELPAVLDSTARTYADRLVLVQNDLHPSDWERRGLPLPTVAVVWFEKKPGREPHVLSSTILFGPHAELVVSALQVQGIEAHAEPELSRLNFELALKNLYVLTTNSVGLAVPGDVGTLWHSHRALVDRVFEEVLLLESALMEQSLPHQALRLEFERIVLADPRHAAAGRVARERLLGACAASRRMGAATPALDEIARQLQNP